MWPLKTSFSHLGFATKILAFQIKGIEIELRKNDSY
ncbi:MAG: hypothetical protein ACJAWV_002531 [Flammeovirgaceae bacterium]|jgi:hypothetical protein